MDMMESPEFYLLNALMYNSKIIFGESLGFYLETHLQLKIGIR